MRCEGDGDVGQVGELAPADALVGREVADLAVSPAVQDTPPELEAGLREKRISVLDQVAQEEGTPHHFAQC